METVSERRSEDEPPTFMFQVNPDLDIRHYAVRDAGVPVQSLLDGPVPMGGALGGVFGAALRLFPWYKEELVHTPWYAYEPLSQSISAILFVALCCYVWFGSLRKPKELIWTK